MNGPTFVMTPLDWALFAWFLGVTIAVGFFYVRRAGKNLSEYFVSARNLPWWALGTSMIATSFASDTPLAVAELVVRNGIAGNWLWWNFLLGGTLTVFLFSRLWRRAGIITEIELISRRYDGAAASALRCFKAVFLGLLINSVVFGWVTQAMGQVLEVVLGIEYHSARGVLAIGVLIAITLAYTALSGLWGVVATDVLQFAVAMAGTIVLAALSVAEVGGLGELVRKVSALEAATGRQILSFVPTGWDAFTGAVLVLVCVNWWAVYYPGAEPGGGGYIAQRMFSARDESHAQGGTLWYILGHYVLRPWPWVLVALCAIVLEPRFLSPGGDPALAAKKAYPFMFHVLPAGMRGLMVAAFAAAYMSTITSLLNLSASYLVNDVYLPFVARSAPRSGSGEGGTGSGSGVSVSSGVSVGVGVARLAVLVVTAFGCFFTWLLESPVKGWQLVMDLTAGTGLVLILRWLWWRVNAWSEISAMAASGCSCVLLHTPSGKSLLARLAGGESSAMVDPLRLLCIAGGTTAVWLLVTLWTRPVSTEKLASFYREVRPFGAWGPIARATGLEPVSARREVLLWILSTALVFSALFGIGAALFLRFLEAGVYLTVALGSGVALWSWKGKRSRLNREAG